MMSMMKIKPLLYAFGSNARVSALGRGFARVRRGNTFRSFALGRRFGPAYVYHTLSIDGASRETSRVVCFFCHRNLLNATVQQKRIFSWAFFSASVVAFISVSAPSRPRIYLHVARTMRPVHPRGRAPLPRARTSRTHVHRPSARGARGSRGRRSATRARRGRRLGSARPARLKLRGRRRAQGDRSRARDPKPRGDSRETRVVPEFVRGRRRVLGFIADARPRRSIGRRGRGRRRRDSRSRAR